MRSPAAAQVNAVDGGHADARSGGDGDADDRVWYADKIAKLTGKMKRIREGGKPDYEPDDGDDDDSESSSSDTPYPSLSSPFSSHRCFVLLSVFILPFLNI